MRLRGKRIVLTGAAGFFGRAFTKGLLEAGAKVYALDRTEIPIQENPRLKTMVVDQSNDGEVSEVATTILAEGAIDVVIHNSFDWKASGFGDQTARLETISREQVMGGLVSGVWWPIALTQPFIAGMKAKGSGNIINIASMYGIVAPSPILYKGTEYFNPVSYGLAKAAIIVLTKYMAAWLGPEIRANALAPGAFPNYGQSDNSKQNQNPEFVDRLKDKTLLARLGEPESDLLAPLLFLASEDSRYITGQVVVVDGGWTVT